MRQEAGVELWNHFRGGVWGWGQGATLDVELDLECHVGRMMR